MLSRLPQQFASKLVPMATLFSLLTISVQLYMLSWLFTIISTCFPARFEACIVGDGKTLHKLIS